MLLRICWSCALALGPQGRRYGSEGRGSSSWLRGTRVQGLLGNRKDAGRCSASNGKPWSLANGRPMGGPPSKGGGVLAGYAQTSGKDHRRG